MTVPAEGVPPLLCASEVAPAGPDPLEHDAVGGRPEEDLLGARRVPAEVYWGIHTLRAIENFPLRDEVVGDVPELVIALASVKQAAAEANLGLGLLPAAIAESIISSCQLLRAGRHHEQFPVPLIQGGAGTSTNMNANEVIANLALERLGRPKGSYDQLSPNEHVNLGQSTNDVYPTALKLALAWAIDGLVTSLERFRDVAEAKAEQFDGIVKMGRTQLQDAVPMTLGQEFRSYSVTISEDIHRIREARAHLLEINLGATAIGTGLNAHPGYAALVCERLAKITQLPVTTSPDLVEATQDCGVFVLVSGAIKRAAIKLSKISSDLRLLSSGPRTGFGEINLPARQAGSSIMPGKVNPVMPEFMNQVAFEVMGLDLTVSVAAEGGQLQLNPFEPVIAASLFRGIRHFSTAVRTLADNCMAGITANEGRLQELVAGSIGLVTALSPYLGYHLSGEIATEALRSGKTIVEIVSERGLIPHDLLERILQPTTIAAGGRQRARGR